MHGWSEWAETPTFGPCRGQGLVGSRRYTAVAISILRTWTQVQSVAYMHVSLIITRITGYHVDWFHLL